MTALQLTQRQSNGRIRVSVGGVDVPASCIATVETEYHAWFADIIGPRDTGRRTLIIKVRYDVKGKKRTWPSGNARNASRSVRTRKSSGSSRTSKRQDSTVRASPKSSIGLSAKRSIAKSKQV